MTLPPAPLPAPKKNTGSRILSFSEGKVPVNH